MKKFYKIIITMIFVFLPFVLLNFTSMMANSMRFEQGSPLVEGYNWMRWSHVYGTVGSIFCLLLFIPIIKGIRQKRVKIFLWPFCLGIIYILFSCVFAVLSQSEFFNQRIAYLEKERLANPDNSSIVESLGNLYGDKGDYDTAIELYSEALLITDTPAYVLHDRSMVLLKKQKFKEALNDVNDAMGKNPDEKDFIAQCYNDRGLIYYNMGEYDKSRMDVQKAIALGYNVHPGFIAALQDLE